MNPLFKTDAYKLFHRQMYPEGTSMVYSNWTPRSTNHYHGQNTEYIIVFGIQRMIKKLITEFEKGFFGINVKLFLSQKESSTFSKVFKDHTVLKYAQQIQNFTGDPSYEVEHIEYLYELGHLPLEIKALPEGVKCPIGVPCMTIRNTDPKCFWLTNYLETYISAELWGMMTSASIANEYREILTQWAEKTGGDLNFVQWQGHDFSMRGMYGIEAAVMSGLGHMTSFSGTDCIPSFIEAQKYYNVDGNDFDKGYLLASSVPATEHSVQCAHYNGEDELDYIDHILNTFPTGLVSIVCDAFDFWKFVTVILPQRRKQILARDGRVVIRPDSGNPVDIICGLPIEAWTRDTQQIPQQKGAIELLWDIFGGTETERGYKLLDSHIGLIYGDAITMDRTREICKRLEVKGFASTNMVLGIGSYTYQHNTRDTFGFAIKCTYVEINGEGKAIYKDPVTKGNVVKKSAKGLLCVSKADEESPYVLENEVSWEREGQGELRTVFLNGELLIEEDLYTIRKRIKSHKI